MLLNSENLPSEETEVTDEMVDKLFDKTFDKARREADKVQKGMSKEMWHILRAKAKRDLFFFNYSILGYTRLSENLHGHLCRHIQATEEDRFRLYLLPRGHFKSTVITIGHTIQVVLPYDDIDRQHDEITTPLPWPNSLGTNCRALIVHEVQSSAARYLFSITSHFTQNPTLMALFPEAVPSPKVQLINKNELELPRTSIWNEPTIDTMGVGGKGQGRHYNFINPDDIYGDKARDSETESQNTIQWFDNLQAFFSKFDQDHLMMNGTRYKHDDVYGHMIDVYGEELTTYIRSVEEFNPKTQQKEPIFPEEFNDKNLRIIKQNKIVYNSQYLNDPDQSGNGFNPSWERLFYWTGPSSIVMYENQSNEDQSLPPMQIKANIRDMDRVIIIDPGEDSGGFVVTGTDYMARTCTLVALRIALQAPDMIDLIFKSVQRWQPRLVAIEADFFMYTLQHWLRAEMKLRGQYFHVEPVYTKKVAKAKRIDGLAPYYEAGNLYHNTQQEDLRKEFKQFRKSNDIHVLDALAYGPELWQKGRYPGSYKHNDAVIGPDIGGRDLSTGYSEIKLITSPY